MTKVTAAEVSKLRKQTGAGMMDCKKALVETNGDFEAAVDFLRKSGQKVAAKRADRDASEGVVLSKASADGKIGILLCLNCETDFVAKNDDFVKLATDLLEVALNEKPANTEAFKALAFEGMTVGEKLIEKTGVIGEKIEISAYEMVESEFVASYIHAGNRLATLVGMTKEAAEAGKDVAMQVAAMNPLGLDKGDVADDVVARERELAMDMAREEGKPEQMIEQIAMGRVNKFYKENTLLNQAFIKDSKKSVSQYLKDVDGDLTVTTFKRVGLGV
ncbi:MAG: elongation factor Ts [Flavobacteriales bacterium]|jgi:elongation factor Ts